MLTEREVSRQWRELFQSATTNDRALAKASELIDALPSTSPLRQRYASELADLQRMRLPPSERVEKRPKRRTAG
jgi:hypothetical protein